MDLLEARKKAKELKKKLEETEEKKGEKKPKTSARKSGKGKKETEKKAKKKSKAKPRASQKKEKKPAKKKEPAVEPEPVEEKKPEQPASTPQPKEEDIFTDLSFGEDLPEVEAPAEEVILEPEKPSPPQAQAEKKESIPEQVKEEIVFKPAPEEKKKETAEPVVQPAEPEVSFEGAETGAEKDFFDLIVEDLVQYGYGEEEAGELLELLSFQLGEEIYAVPLVRIQQIIKPRPMTYVPRAPEYILGIISLRGTIIPIFDLKQRLGLGKSEVGRKSRIIIIKLNEKAVAGLLVDQVLEVARVPASGLEPTPAIFSGVEGEFIEGIARFRGRMLIVLNLRQVILGRKEGEE